MADPAKAGASPKSQEQSQRCPEPPEMLAASYTMPTCQPPQGTQTCGNEQSQLLLLHWAERCSSCRATEMPLASLQLGGAGSKNKITTSLSLI